MEKYVVELTSEEQRKLYELVLKGKASAHYGEAGGLFIKPFFAPE